MAAKSTILQVFHFVVNPFETTFYIMRLYVRLKPQYLKYFTTAFLDQSLIVPHDKELGVFWNLINRRLTEKKIHDRKMIAPGHGWLGWE